MLIESWIVITTRTSAAATRKTAVSVRLRASAMGWTKAVSAAPISPTRPIATQPSA